ncbi:MAG: zinc ribbon domain-containing protein [Thermoplasmata archaeon]
MIVRTWKGHINSGCILRTGRWLNLLHTLYNAGLEQRIIAYREYHKMQTYNKQAIELPEYGEIVHKSLSERIHVCPSCGFIADRGYNASLNILRSGWDTALVPVEKAALPAKATAFFETGSPEL